MAQPFPCNCNTRSCRGLISGAKDMTHDQLAGYWLSGHIRELKGEQEQQQQQQRSNGNGNSNGTANLKLGSNALEAALPLSSASSSLRPPQPQRVSSAGLDRKDPTVQALQEALVHAEKVVVAAKSALVSYLDVPQPSVEQRR